jgi:Ca-activated chloride channel family protein
MASHWPASRASFDHSRARSNRWLERTIKLLNLAAPGLLAIAILLLAGPQRMTESADARVLTNIEFCLDVSGSMMARFGDGKRSDKALEAINEFTSFRKGDAFGLTAFGSEVLHWVPITKDLSALRSRRRSCVEKCRRMAALMDAARGPQASRRATGRRRMVILISDGQAPPRRRRAAKSARNWR